MVNLLFSKINIEKDKAERKKIVDGYDAYVINIVSKNNSIESNVAYIIYFFAIVGGLSLIKICKASLIVNLINMVIIVGISLFGLVNFISMKNSKIKNNKLLFKQAVMNFIIVNVFIYLAIVIFQSITTKNLDPNIYIVILVVAILINILCYLLLRISGPKKFIADFLKGDIKYKSYDGVIVGATSVLIVIISIIRPYSLLLGLSYAIFVPFAYFMWCVIYRYSQYSTIEEVKRKI